MTVAVDTSLAADMTVAADTGPTPYDFGYVLVKDACTPRWVQQGYVKASNTGSNDQFGTSVTLSADGNTLAVGAYCEDSNATVVGGDQTNDTDNQ